MAGDWIKMRGNLWDDPRIARICDLTDSTEGPVIGALYWLWAAADQHTENGIMPGLTLRQIDRKTGLDGFGEALCQVGWLADHPEGVRIVKFEEHNGTSAKSRLEAAKRVAKHRAKEPDHPVGDEYAYQRLSFPRALVTAVLDRDGHQCVYCHRAEGSLGPMETKPDGILHLDHVIPLSRGGACDESNLVASCRKCNMQKANRNPDECGFDWPLMNGKRIGNTKHVTDLNILVSGALPRERERVREERKDKETAPSELAESPPKGADPPPPPPFDGNNAKALNGKFVVSLSPGWELPEDWGVDAEALGWQPKEVLYEAEKFRQYWTAGKGIGTRRAVKGWRQSWSNWLGKAAERKIR